MEIYYWYIAGNMGTQETTTVNVQFAIFGGNIICDASSMLSLYPKQVMMTETSTKKATRNAIIPVRCTLQ